MKTFLRTGVAVLALAVLGFAGCKKAVEEAKDTVVSAEDNVFAETAMASAFDVIDDVGTTDGKVMKSGSTILPGGAILNFTDSTYSDGDGVEFNVDFGNYDANAAMKGLLCPDGRYRAGKIFISVSDHYLNVGTILTATFNDDASAYYCGNGLSMTKVTGELKVTRSAQNQVKIVVSNGKAVYEQGTVEFHSDRTVTRTVGQGQPGSMGDEYEITGSGGGKNRDGEEYTTSITEKLVKKIQDGCADTFIKGKIELTNTSSGAVLKIDFDPGNNAACDKTVQVTLPNGLKKSVTVK